MACSSASSLDLFAGAGGLTAGFVLEGVRPVLAVELAKRSNDAQTVELPLDSKQSIQ
jgi:site-specific DNA-cytosine methylase